MHYMHSINDNRYYTFTSDAGLELVTLGKPNEDGDCTERTKYIANFWPEVINRVELKTSEGVVTLAKLKLVFTDGAEDEEFTVPLQDLDKLCWPEIDLRCIPSPDVPKANEHIASIIRSECFEATLEKMGNIDRLGTHIADDIPVFNRGDMLIWPEGLANPPAVKWKPDPNFRLAVDPNYSERKADAGMLRIIDLSHETGRFVFSFNILNVLREAFVRAGVVPRCILYIYGFTGIKKTTFTNFQSHIYNRDKPLEPPTRFNASVAAAVKLLYEKSDCAVLMDDIYRAEDKEIHRQQEKTLLEITRVAGDGIEPARMRGQRVAKAPPRCGVLFIGEYCIGKGSDAARMLPIKMTIPVDNDKLSACQREPLMLSTFYDYFIKWYISNFDNICELLKEWVAVYRSTKTGIHDRLQETQFCLEAAYKLYLTYRMEKDFISEADSLDEYDSFYNQLRTHIVKQNDRVNQVTKINPNVNYLAMISTMFRTKRFQLVESVKDFVVKEHDGIIHKEHLYLRSDKLMKRIRTIESAAEFDEVLDCLKKHNALKTGPNSNSRQIHGCRRSLRFYVIKLAMLR